MKDKLSFYKYKSLSNFEFLLDILLKERLYAASYHELNDPMEGVIKVDGTVPRDREREWEEIIRDLRIICFTKDPNNPLMWSHYADGGKGCLVEFELINDHKYHKVSYSKKPIVADKDINIEKAIEILKYKEKPWKYEAEYRCILSGKTFLPVNIKSVTFGPRSDDESVKMLIHILSQCKPDLKLYRENRLGVFKKPELLIGHKRTYVKLLDSNECPKCAANKMMQQDFVGMHRD